MEGFNRLGSIPKSRSNSGGGTLIYYSNPVLAGSIRNDLGYGFSTILVDTLNLEGEFLRIEPIRDYAYEQLTVNGGLVMTTSPVCAKRITLNVLEGSRDVSMGDPLACFEFIQDYTRENGAIPGMFSIINYFNGKKRQVVVKDVYLKTKPYLIKEGMAVPTYACEFICAGVAEVDLGYASNKAKLWAVGNKNSVEGTFSPFIDTQTNEPFVNENINNGISSTAQGNDDYTDDSNFDNIVSQLVGDDATILKQ